MALESYEMLYAVPKVLEKKFRRARNYLACKVSCTRIFTGAIIAPGLPFGSPHSHWASPRAIGHALCLSCHPLGVAVILDTRASLLASPDILAVAIALRSVDSM
jgi:hypothetical protein